MLYPICENDRYGYINRNGEIVLPTNHDYCTPFESELGAILNGRQLKIVDTELRVVGMRENVEDILGIGDQVVCVRECNCEGVRYLKSSGELLIDEEFENGWEFLDGLAVVERNEKCGVINKRGEWVVPPLYWCVYGFGVGMTTSIANLSNDDCRKAARNDAILIDRHGRQVGNGHYEGGAPGTDGLIPVRRRGKWGFANELGETVIPLVFSNVQQFVDGLAGAKGDKGWGLIDRSGHWCLSPDFGYIDIGSEGLFAASESGDPSDPETALDSEEVIFGYIDKKGSWVIRPQYQEAEPFHGGVAKVSLGTAWETSYIDRHGTVIRRSPR